MKKNLMSVLIMALVFVNVVLSAVIMITLVPAAKQSNELITKVSSAIELELEGGKVYNANTIPVDNTSVRTLTGEDVKTFTLKRDTDGKDHYVVTRVSITMDKTDSDYEEKAPQIEQEGREVLLQEIVSNTFLNYTYDEVRSPEGQVKVRNDMLLQMQELFDSDFIVAVNFSETNYQ
ncbi:MAG: flagellar basal body-associated FliL family protein [Eubacterium sp.]|nr:flagellar basal body-associated FliL family protein [Eubacterium sp.]